LWLQHSERNHKSKFPTILEQEVEAYNARKQAEKKNLFEENARIVSDDGDMQHVNPLAENFEPYSCGEDPTPDASSTSKRLNAFVQQFTYARITEENLDDEQEELYSRKRPLDDHESRGKNLRQSKILND